MHGKCPQDVVGLALRIHRAGQMDVESLDGRGHRPGAALRTVPAQPRTLRRYSVISSSSRCASAFTGSISESVCERPFQVPLAEPQCPDRRRVFQAHRPFLKRFVWPGKLAQLRPGLQGEGHSVNLPPRRLHEEVGGVQRAELMFEDGLAALEGEMPVVQLSHAGRTDTRPADSD